MVKWPKIAILRITLKGLKTLEMDLLKSFPRALTYKSSCSEGALVMDSSLDRQKSTDQDYSQNTFGCERSACLIVEVK